MNFNDKVNNIYKVFLEQEPPKDATEPQDPDASAMPEPAPAAQPKTQVPPEGYVDIVRLLAKALVMDIPAGTIDDLFTLPITAENAEEVREGLEKAIGRNEMYGDNPEKLDNIHFKKFVSSINENNFMQRYKNILTIMKKYSDSI